MPRHEDSSEIPSSAPLALTQDQFTALLAAVTQPANAGLDAAKLREILLETSQVSAQAMKRAMKPENDTHPGKSVYSYPEGDAAKPRPVLPHELYWQGFPVHQYPETQHWLELELLARLQPGEYFVSKANNEGAHKISVRGERDATSKLTKIVVENDKIGRDEMRAAPPQAVWIYQMLHPDRPLGETYMEGTVLFMNHVAMGKPPVEEPVTA
jgi:hypothetical protein